MHWIKFWVGQLGTTQDAELLLALPQQFRICVPHQVSLERLSPSAFASTPAKSCWATAQSDFHPVQTVLVLKNALSAK